MRDTTFFKNRDHIQIIADILIVCRSPQTQSYVRRQTYLSYDVLQNCINQLLMFGWLEPFEKGNGQKRLATTKEGWVFLEKYVELQELMDPAGEPKMKAAANTLKVDSQPL